MRPNFDANAATWAKDPDFDPGNKYSMAWQSGLTGIGCNTEKVSQPITTMDDLMNPDIVGTHSVGMLKGDMPDLVMINLGIDPATSGPEEWQEAADWIQMQKESGTVRKFYDQGYIDDFTAGNLAAVDGVVGRRPLLQDLGGQAVRVHRPRGWGAAVDRQHDDPGELGEPAGRVPADGLRLPAGDRPDDHRVGRVHVARARRAGPDRASTPTEESGEFAAELEDMAESPFLWPDDALLAKTPFGRNLTTDEEREEWDAIFLPITET